MVSGAAVGTGADVHTVDWNFPDLSYLDPEILRTFFEVFPGESTREFGHELVPERDRVMIIEEDEEAVQGQLPPGF
jgi:hypothetical protein